MLRRDVVTPARPSRSAFRFPLPGGLEVELFAVPGKVALYLEGEDPALAAETGANVGVEIVCGDAPRSLYVPGAAAVHADAAPAAATAPTLFCSTPRSSSTTR